MEQQHVIQLFLKYDLESQRNGHVLAYKLIPLKVSITPVKYSSVNPNKVSLWVEVCMEFMCM